MVLRSFARRPARTGIRELAAANRNLGRRDRNGGLREFMDMHDAAHREAIIANLDEQAKGAEATFDTSLLQALCAIAMGGQVVFSTEYSGGDELNKPQQQHVMAAVIFTPDIKIRVEDTHVNGRVRQSPISFADKLRADERIPEGAVVSVGEVAAGSSFDYLGRPTGPLEPALYVNGWGMLQPGEADASVLSVLSGDALYTAAQGLCVVVTEPIPRYTHMSPDC